MVAVVMIIALLVSVLIQTLFPDTAFMCHAKPPFMLAVAIYYALHTDIWLALIAGFSAGLISDALSPVPLGYSSFCFMLACWIVGKSRNAIRSDSLTAAVIVGAVITFAADIMLFGMMARAKATALTVRQGLMHSVGTAVLGAFVIPVVDVAMNALDRLVGNIRLKGEIIDAG